MTKRNLTSGSISGHVRALAIPSAIGLVFQTMYNVVDSFYAGQISTTALAALGLSFPVFLLVIAISGGLSRGSSALIANAIGSGDQVRQQQYICQCLSLGFVASIALTLTGLTVGKPLFSVLGASGDYLNYAVQYMTPIFLGAVFFVLTSLCNAILIANGDSRTFSKVLVVGFFMNLLLDPWFLHGGYGLPAMGIAGIAWATVVIQVASCGFMLFIVVNRGLVSLRPWKALLPDWKVYREILQQAVPASFAIMSVAFGFFTITYFLKFYGPATVAAFGVSTRIEQLALLPTFGLYSAIMALVGQNNGAGDFDRVRESMRICNRAGWILVLCTSSLIFVFAEHLMGVFTSDPEVISIGVVYVHIAAVIQWSYVMTSTHLAFLQAVKRPRYCYFESPLRKVVLPLPLLWFFVTQRNSDVEYVWYSVAVANVLMTFITVFYARRVIARL